MSKQLAQSEETAIAERTPQLIAAEIRSIDTQTRDFVLRSAVEIGKRLVEAKSLVAHGEWGKWLQDNVSYRQSTANNFMRISNEYADSQTLGHLSYTQAIALLSLPAEERETFVAEHDLDNISTRELAEAIKEQNRLKQELQQAEDRAAKEREERLQQAAKYDEYAQTIARENQQRVAEIERLQAELQVAVTAKDDDTADKVKEQLRKAKNELNEKNKRLKQLEEELKKKPIDVPKVEVPDSVKQELEELRRREQELENQAKKTAEESARKIAEMQALLEKNNNTAAIQVKVCFDTLVKQFNDLLEAVGQVQNEEEKQKYREAIGKLCDRMKDTL